jgi:hypothetical protein
MSAGGARSEDTLVRGATDKEIEMKSGNPWRTKRVLASLCAVLVPVAALAGAAQQGKVFSERHYSATIEPAGVQVDRIGVRLPVNAKIPKVEVFADVSDMGDRTGEWKKCDIDSKRCAVGDVRIVAFHRREHRDTDEPWQELSVDMANESGSETRAVKLLVTYQPQGGGDLKQCRLETDCGWHERVAAP